MNIEFEDIFFIVLGVFGSVIATGICYLIKIVWTNYQTRKSKYTGYWRTYIYDETGTNIIKEDILELKHNVKTNEFKGTIKRDLPTEQRHRDWVFKGVFINESMLLVFWSKQAIPSYGVEYLVLVGDLEFQGYYLKKDHNSDNIYKVKIVNKKV